jgi:hypothetical protein
MKNPKRGKFLKEPGENSEFLDPAGSVPAVIRRLKLPSGPVGSMFAWYHDRLDRQRCQVAESRRRSADRRARKALVMRRYRRKLRKARQDLPRWRRLI